LKISSASTVSQYICESSQCHGAQAEPAAGRSKGNRKSSVASESFGRMVDGTRQKYFKKVGKDAMKNPQLRSKIIGHIMATLEQPSVVGTTKCSEQNHNLKEKNSN
jgi:hypothetical protein